MLAIRPDAETKQALSPTQRDALLTTLKARFERNAGRHKGLDWAKVLLRGRINTRNRGSEVSR